MDFLPIHTVQTAESLSLDGNLPKRITPGRSRRKTLGKLPSTLEEIPSEWGKWSRITTIGKSLIDKDGNIPEVVPASAFEGKVKITWAAGWFGKCQVSGEAKSVGHAKGLMENAVRDRLPEFYKELRVLQGKSDGGI